MILIEAMLMSPLAAVDPDDLATVHAVEIRGAVLHEWETAGTVAAACGAQVKLLECPWPIPTRYTDMARCQGCRAEVGGAASQQTRKWWKRAAS